MTLQELADNEESFIILEEMLPAGDRDDCIFGDKDYEIYEISPNTIGISINDDYVRYHDFDPAAPVEYVVQVLRDIYKSKEKQ